MRPCSVHCRARRRSAQLPFRASFLLPHHRATWIRFGERLDELSTFARGLSPADGRDVVASVSEALDRIAASLLSQVEQVEASSLTG